MASIPADLDVIGSQSNDDVDDGLEEGVDRIENVMNVDFDDSVNGTFDDSVGGTRNSYTSVADDNLHNYSNHYREQTSFQSTVNHHSSSSKFESGQVNSNLEDECSSEPRLLSTYLTKNNEDQSSVISDQSVENQHSQHKIFLPNVEESDTVYRYNENNLQDFHQFSDTDSVQNQNNYLPYRNHHKKMSDDSIDNNTGEMQFYVSERPKEQLALLYEERGREIDKLNGDLAALSHDVFTMKRKHADLNVSNNQMKILLQEVEAYKRRTESELKDKEIEICELKEENIKLKDQNAIFESHIARLNQQGVELANENGLAKSREMHSEFISKLRNIHNANLDKLQHELKISKDFCERAESELCHHKADSKIMKQSFLTEFAAKNLLLQELNIKLKVSQDHCKDLLESGKISFSAQQTNQLIDENKNLKRKLDLALKDLEMHDLLVKLGLFKSAQNPEDTVGLLDICPKTLNFEDSRLVEKESPLKKSIGSAATKKKVDKSGTENLSAEFMKMMLCNKEHRVEKEKLRELLTVEEEKIKRLSSELKICRDELYELKGCSNQDIGNMLLEYRSTSFCCVSSLIILEIENFILQIVDLKNEGITLDAMLDYLNEFVKTKNQDSFKVNKLQAKIKEFSHSINNFLQMQKRLLLINKDIKVPSCDQNKLKKFVEKLKNLNEYVQKYSQADPSDKQNSKEIYTQWKNLFEQNCSLTHDMTILTQRCDILKEENIKLNADILLTREALEHSGNELKQSYGKFSDIEKVKQSLCSEYSLIIIELKEENQKIINELKQKQIEINSGSVDSNIDAELLQEIKNKNLQLSQEMLVLQESLSVMEGRDRDYRNEVENLKESWLGERLALNCRVEELQCSAIEMKITLQEKIKLVENLEKQKIEMENIMRIGSNSNVVKCDKCTQMDEGKISKMSFDEYNQALVGYKSENECLISSHAATVSMLQTKLNEALLSKISCLCSIEINSLKKQIQGLSFTIDKMKELRTDGNISHNKQMEELLGQLSVHGNTIEHLITAHKIEMDEKSHVYQKEISDRKNKCHKLHASQKKYVKYIQNMKEHIFSWMTKYIQGVDCVIKGLENYDVSEGMSIHIDALSLLRKDFMHLELNITEKHRGNFIQ